MSVNRPSRDRDVKDDLNEQFARIGKALANSHRVEILDLLAQGDRSVETLATRAGMSVGLTSSHLQVLRRAGLIAARRDGTRIVYRLAGDDVYRLLVAVRTVATDRIADAERAARVFLGGPAETVTRSDLLERVRSGSVVVVDLRPSEEYEAGHVAGALSIPLSELEARLTELPGGCRGRGLLPRPVLCTSTQRCRTAPAGGTTRPPTRGRLPRVAPGRVAGGHRGRAGMSEAAGASEADPRAGRAPILADKIRTSRRPSPPRTCSGKHADRRACPSRRCRRCVSSISDGDIVGDLVRSGRAVRDPAWACYHTDLHVLGSDGLRLGFVGGVVGASFAVLVAEELFASGCRLLLSLTSAGRVTSLGEPPYFVLIDRALRDEGTSYHYLPPARYSEADPSLVSRAADALRDAGLTVHRGSSWTTDAPFRETASAMRARQAEGILAVEMEAAALYAFAAARGRAVLCFAHITNQMAQAGADFEKGPENGATEALGVVEVVARALQWVSGPAGPPADRPDRSAE